MSSIQLSRESVGFLFALGSAALFSIRPVFVKLVYAEGIDSFTLIYYRMLFSAPIYLCILIWLLRKSSNRERLSVKTVFITCIAGVLGYFAASYFDLLGLQYVTAQLGRVILYTYPTFVVILGALFFQQKITGRTVISLFTTYLGISIIFGHDLNHFGSNTMLGSSWIIGSAILFSLYLLMSKGLINQLGSQLFTCIALIAASLVIFTVYKFSAVPTLNLLEQPKVLVLLLAIALFCTVIPTFFTTAAVDLLGADKTGIIAMTGPAFTAIFAVYTLNEAFTIYHLSGIMLVILGVAMLRKKD